MKPLETSIILNGLKFYAYHGVLNQENIVGANYIINITLYTDFSIAAETDNLDGTINYAEVYELIKEEMKTKSNLLENVVFRISKTLFNYYNSVYKIDIELFKENPPMGADCNNIGVRAVYSR